MIFAQCFVAALLGSAIGIMAASIWAYHYNKKWMDNHKD